MTKDLTQGSPLKLILEFAIPLLAGMLFQQFYNLVDTMIVGRFLGVTALAGVGATGSINFLVLGFCMGVCAGFAIPVAQQFGAKDEEKLRAYVANGAIVAGVFTLLILSLTVVFCRPILTAMHTPEDCYEQAYSYIVVIFAGIPFIFLYNMLSGYIRSLGDSKTPLYFLIFSSLLNIALDLTFILVFHMGVMGASLATVISQAISGILCLWWIWKKIPMLHVRRHQWKLQAALIKNLCMYGVPMGLQYSITAIGSVILQIAVNSLGSMAVAAATAGGKVLGFLGCPFEALGSTMATYGAQNVGANRYDRLNRGMYTAVAIGFVYSVIAFGVAYFFGRNFAGLFVSGEGGSELINLAWRYMLVNVLFYPALTMVNVVRFTIQGMGFSMFAVIAGVMEMIARSLAGIVLVPLLGFLGASLGGPLAWIFADSFLIPAYYRCRSVLMSGFVHHHYNEKDEIAERMAQE